MIIEKLKTKMFLEFIDYESFPSYAGTSAKEWKCVVLYLLYYVIISKLILLLRDGVYILILVFIFNREMDGHECSLSVRRSYMYRLHPQD